MIYTLALSHRLAWYLEPTGANLRASGVYDFNNYQNCSTSCPLKSTKHQILNKVHICQQCTKRVNSSSK